MTALHAITPQWTALTYITRAHTGFSGSGFRDEIMRLAQTHPRVSCHHLRAICPASGKRQTLGIRRKSEDSVRAEQLDEIDGLKAGGGGTADVAFRFRSK